eukprot:963230-Rhodomonas_salina.1
MLGQCCQLSSDSYAGRAAKTQTAATARNGIAGIVLIRVCPCGSYLRRSAFSFEGSHSSAASHACTASSNLKRRRGRGKADSGDKMMREEIGKRERERGGRGRWAGVVWEKGIGWKGRRVRKSCLLYTSPSPRDRG